MSLSLSPDIKSFDMVYIFSRPYVVSLGYVLAVAGFVVVVFLRILSSIDVVNRIV